ncbi:CDCA2 protein, partial [Turnix velox]|nr:CDCA2 protein [Turnix velox]
GALLGEFSLPVTIRENISRSRSESLEGECCVTPDGDKAEEKTLCGTAEKQRRKPVDFATVTIGDFGITQESFTKPSTGNSPSLKYRRRSAIGVRGSPENNTLIQFLAQQRSNR